MFLHHPVVEILTGVPPVPDGSEVEPRPEYHPRNLLGDRIEAKLAELRATGTPMSCIRSMTANTSISSTAQIPRPCAQWRPNR